MMKTLARMTMAVAAALMLSCAADGSVIWSDDFEDGNTNGWIEVWGGLPDYHAFQPTAIQFNLPLTSPAGGTWALWVQQNDSWAARSGGTIAPDTQYELCADVGRMLTDCNPNPGLWHLQLFAGTSAAPVTLLTEIAFDTPGANLPTPGNWAENSVVFNSTDSSHVGETLWVRLYSDPVGGVDNCHYDNVCLITTPEPGTLALFACCAIVLTIFTRTSRKESRIH
jgi:hypothetical protein